MATNPQNKSGVLLTSKAPNLPIAPVEYTQQYQDQVLNALRLYFNQIDNFTQSIAIPNSGPTSSRPLSTVQTPLGIGQNFFDTTLGIPIWWNGTVWKNASGGTV
jgi:hypothetical protein